MGLLSTIGAASARSFGLTRLSAAIKDAYFNLTTLLLPGNGTNGAQNNTFLDSSSNNFTITRNGNATQGTFSPFSQTGWSNYFGGSGAYLSASANAAFDFGTSDFTIEAWIYIAGNSPLDGSSRRYANIFSVSTSSGFNFDFVVKGDSSTTGTGLEIYNGSSIVGVTGTISQNTWNHVAVSKSGSSVYFWLNGVQLGATQTGVSGSWGSSANGAQVGRALATNYTFDLNGYLSNLRVTKGGALYTSAFTPSTAPLTTTVSAGTVSLLTCQDNRFKDNSSNAFAITTSGTPSVQAFSPFAPTAAYSAATNGGSGYFDGSGDWIQAAAATGLTFGTGAFTVEAWLYPTSGSGTERDFISNISSTGDADTVFGARISSSNTIITSTYLNNLVGGSITVPLNTWTHYLFSFDGTTYRQFINGAADGTSTTVRNISNSTNPWTIGRTNWTARYFTGNIAGVRLVKGSAVQTSAFTPPTAPPTAITNTQLLLNFTNGGIFDQTGKNVLETVGNAQISTTQSKFGGSSMYFDGTGDWLTVIDSPNLRMEGGDFTIEGWFYLSATGVAYGIVSKGTSTTGWSVNITSGNKLQFSYTSSNLTGATTLSSATWYYFAVVRSGTATGNLKLYLNGSADATSAGAVTDTFNQTNIMYVGADRAGGSALNGYIDDLRITKGYARTISTPTSAFALQ